MNYQHDQNGEPLACDQYVTYQGVSYFIVGFDEDVAFCRADGGQTLRQIHCGRLLRDEDRLSAGERIDAAVQAMVETQPSWGWRLSRVWSALGHDFGTWEDLEWSMQRDFFRAFQNSEEARAAMAAGIDYPPPRRR